VEVQRALDQIEEIHTRLARAETCETFKAVPAAFAGALALVGAALQPIVVGSEPSAQAFVLYWVAMAAICGTTGGGRALLHSFARVSETAQLRNRVVVAQFLPCMLAGAVVTILLTTSGSGDAIRLPGIWAILFGLGLFSSRPYLPRRVGFVGLFYLLTGTVLLAQTDPVAALSPWGMGLTFGLGHFALALVLYWDIERKNHD